jgi:DNA-binding MarR family transcriptional regulator
MATPFVYRALLSGEQLHSEQLRSERPLSSPSADRRALWQVFWETALGLLDVLDAELQRDGGIPMRWYDVLIHVENDPAGMRMNELAEQILTSKSGLTRVVDRMEEEGLVRRVRPEHDRRAILVVLTDRGRETMERARIYHRDAIERYFTRHLTDAEAKTLARVFTKVRAGVR